MSEAFLIYIAKQSSPSFSIIMDEALILCESAAMLRGGNAMYKYLDL